VRPGADAEEVIRLRKFHILEEDVRHAGVVVLTRVDETLLHVGPAVERGHQRRDLNEVGPRPDHV
jgi:hypothetical protein